MPTIDTKQLERQLEDEALSYGIPLTAGQEALLLKHLDLVLEKNKVMNLTRITDPVDAIRLHVIDSLLLLGPLREAGGTFLDVGAGAGYPGIPLAVVSGTDGVLLDSVGKKVKAVHEFVEELGLGRQLQCANERVESYALSHRSQFAAVTMRAVASLAVIVEYAAPLLRRGGRLIVTKARLASDEFDSGCRAATICGLSSVSRETFELPACAGFREILVFERTGNPAIRLPRQVGMAKKLPLGRGD